MLVGIISELKSIIDQENLDDRSAMLDEFVNNRIKEYAYTNEVTKIDQMMLSAEQINDSNRFCMARDMGKSLFEACPEEKSVCTNTGSRLHTRRFYLVI